MAITILTTIVTVVVLVALAIFAFCSAYWKDRATSGAQEINRLNKYINGKVQTIDDLRDKLRKEQEKTDRVEGELYKTSKELDWYKKAHPMYVKGDTLKTCPSEEDVEKTTVSD